MSFAVPRSAVPAVDVRQLRKEFRRRVRTDGRFARKRTNSDSVKSSNIL